FEHGGEIVTGRGDGLCCGHLNSWMPKRRYGVDGLSVSTGAGTWHSGAAPTGERQGPAHWP
ncbi:MAG TPA: hypothetical protein VIQ29_06710, partial [Ancylobacter sp.]